MVFRTNACSDIRHRSGMGKEAADLLQDHELDKTIPVPLYFQLKNLLLKEIQSQACSVEASIPTEKELSEMFGISRTTVRKAIAELVQEGWLYRIKSKGTYVVRVKIKQDFIKRLENFNDQIKRTGHIPTTEVLEQRISEMPPQFYPYFDLNEGGKYVYLYRRRFADDEPIVSLKTYLPFELCSFVLKHNFEGESLYNVLATNRKTRICRVNRVLEAVGADAQDMKNLNVCRGKPIQFSITIGYNSEDEPIEYSIARYRGDRNRFEVDLWIDRNV